MKPLLKKWVSPKMAGSRLDEIFRRVVARNAGPQFVFHPTTLAYARSLLEPIESVLEAQSTSDAIQKWIARELPNSDLLLYEVRSALRANPAGMDYARYYILMALAGDLLDPLKEYLGDHGIDRTALPWDIMDAAVPETRHLFAFPDDKRLPVTIRVRGETRVERPSMEWTMGVVLFSTMFDLDLRVSMYGVELTYFEDEQLQVRYDSNVSLRYPRYIGVFADWDWSFYSWDFVDGMETAAEWLRVDMGDFDIHYQTVEGGEILPIGANLI